MLLVYEAFSYQIQYLIYYCVRAGGVSSRGNELAADTTQLAAGVQKKKDYHVSSFVHYYMCVRILLCVLTAT